MIPFISTFPTSNVRCSLWRIVFLFVIVCLHFAHAEGVLTDGSRQVICQFGEEGIIVCDGENYVLQESCGELEEEPFGTPMFWMYILISIGLTLTAGVMSGLTIGMMSLDILNLRVLQKGGTRKERAYATRIIPVVEKHHLLLVSLLLANAACMEALPIFLDRVVHPAVAIIISVTGVLMFGEVIPQAICKRYGLAIGANMAWFCAALMVLLLPITWPISKVLDCLLGKDHHSFYRRAELKELVRIHGDQKGNQDDALSPDECLIIKGALDMKMKSVFACMTHLENVFMLPMDAIVNKETLEMIVREGHSRIPIYNGDRDNIVGLILIKSLLLLDPEHPVPISQVEMRLLPSVNSDTPLYDMLNQFQTGKSHMAAVRGVQTGKILGIITLEDVMEELIGEEILDETDVYIDADKKIKAVRILNGLNDIKNVGLPSSAGNNNVVLNVDEEDGANSFEMETVKSPLLSPDKTNKNL